MVASAIKACIVALLCATCCDRIYSGEPNGRVEVPSLSEQGEAAKNIREIYRREIEEAKTPDSQRVLAEKWIAVAEESSDDNSGRYMLLMMAKEMLVPLGDVEGVVKVIERMVETFEVAEHSLYAETLSAMARYIPKVDRVTLGNRSLVIGKRALLDQEYRASEELANLALAMARKEKNLSLARRSTLLLKGLESAKKKLPDFENAKRALDDAPSDPTSNQIVGEFYCFELEDWEAGIAKLALSKDREIKACAKAELQLFDGIGSNVEVADAWWTLSGKYRDNQSESIRNHASDLYRESVEGLIGPERERVEGRITNYHVQERPTEWWGRIDAKKHSIVGNWLIKNGTLVSPESRQVSGFAIPNTFQLPHEVSESYTVEMQVVRLGGKRNLMIGLAHKRGLFVVSIDCGEDGLSTGLGNLEGKLSNDNITTVRGPFLMPGRPSRIVCDVSPRAVAVSIDQQQIIKWTGDVSRWSLKDGPFDDVKLESGRLFLAADVFSQFEISNIDVRTQASPVPVGINSRR